MNPLTALYGAVTALRNTLYDRGVISSHRLAHPVISIGNLSMGGSGKTPFVIALGELLKARGISFDVLSRGYRRKTRGVLVVDPNGRASDFGDEPLLIARRLNVPVIVGESRLQAGQLAEQKCQSQLHILDDGFQHRSLARDFDIVLMTERDFDDRLLPSGHLREPLSSLQRADAIILPQELSVPTALLNRFAQSGKAVWRMTRELLIPQRPASPIVFCGIARPDQFFAHVRTAGITPAAELPFRDHHAYTSQDVQALLRARTNKQAGGFLATEKDAINLGPRLAELAPLTIATLTVILDNPAGVIDAILARIAERKPRS